MFRLISDPDNKKILRNNVELPQKISRAMRRGSYISGKQLVEYLEKDMKKGKSGRQYKVYKGIGGKDLKRPRLHIASSESETPAIITGEFRKSINFKVRGNKRLEFGSGEGGAQKYAKLLEVGTSKMKARQPLGQTVKKLQNQVKTNIAKEINKAIEQSGFTVTKI